MASGTQTNTNEKIRVLVTDDSRVMRKAISKILQDDADLIEAEDGEQGWNQLLANDDIQVMITDIEMPVLDGYQLICRIRAHEDPRINSVPIITITGAEDEETKTRAYACGATDFIVKPLDKVQLQARVQAHAKLDDTTRALAETEATLEEEAANDPLTGLASRKYFTQRCEQDVAHAVRHNTSLSIMRIDIDNFKKLYQENGDDGADNILKGFSRLIKSAARAEDTIARIGGSEFAIAAPATDHEKAMHLAERIRAMISNHGIDNGTGLSVQVTASIGVSCFGDDGNQLAQLLEKADHRLRDAKAEGGNVVCAAARDESVAASATEELTLDTTIEDRAATTAIPGTARDSQPATPDIPVTEPVLPIPPELIDISRAIDMLNRGMGEKISPYLLDLSLRVLPILEYCDQMERLNIASELDNIKERLYSRKT